MPVTKTDNHFTSDKVRLRINYSPWNRAPTLRVLDAFGGYGRIWKAVGRITGNTIERIAIDQRADLLEFHCHGDNIKVMAGLDLARFHVIDLDAYGIPAEQIDLVLKSKFNGVVFVTAIQSMQGQIPARIADEIGMPPAVQKKAPTLLARRGWSYFKEWMAVRGVKRIIHRSWNRKHYLTFTVNGAELPAAGYSNQQANTVAGLS